MLCMESLMVYTLAKKLNPVAIKLRYNGKSIGILWLHLEAT